MEMMNELMQPTPDSQPDRRTHERFPVEIEVTLQSEHNFFTGFTENISEGGLFIATHQVAEIGARFEVSFTLEGFSEPIEVQCEVRWIRPYHEDLDGPPGMGVRFLDLPPETQRAVQSFSASRQTIFYED